MRQGEGGFAVSLLCQGKAQILSIYLENPINGKERPYILPSCSSYANRDMPGLR